MACKLCTDPDGAACFPLYGIGPHVHLVDGRTMLIPGAQMAGYTPNPQDTGFGWHWCPACGDGKPEGAECPSPLLKPACDLSKEGGCDSCQ